jgi:glycosyltransferase involved in cell wall biosynthesis
VSTATAPLRVHILIDSLTWGGAEMLLGDLAAGAPAAGMELSVGYLNERDGSPAAVRLRGQGVEPVLVPVHGLLNPSGYRAVRTHLARVRPDVVHTQLVLADILGTLAARSLGLPVVSTFHLVAGHSAGQPMRGRRRSALKGHLAGFVRRHAGARVIAVSDAAREAYLATGWDVPERVVAVHNGIARAPRPGAGASVRAELGIAQDELVLSTVTVLRRDKGHDVAIEAVRRMLARFPRLRLLILGDGPAREEIRQLADPLGTAVLMTGHRDDVLDVLAATDVLLHPTSMDAFPTALLEAAAASVPVLATAVGGIPEIVQDGVTGVLLAAPATPEAVVGGLTPLLADPELRRALGVAAAESFNARFTAERWAQRLRSVYLEALAEAH